MFENIEDNINRYPWGPCGQSTYGFHQRSGGNLTWSSIFETSDVFPRRRPNYDAPRRATVNLIPRLTPMDPPLSFPLRESDNGSFLSNATQAHETSPFVIESRPYTTADVTSRYNGLEIRNSQTSQFTSPPVIGARSGEDVTRRHSPHQPSVMHYISNTNNFYDRPIEQLPTQLLFSAPSWQGENQVARNALDRDLRNTIWPDQPTQLPSNPRNRVPARANRISSQNVEPAKGLTWSRPRQQPEQRNTTYTGLNYHRSRASITRKATLQATPSTATSSRQSSIPSTSRNPPLASVNRPLSLSDDDDHEWSDNDTSSESDTLESDLTSDVDLLKNRINKSKITPYLAEFDKEASYTEVEVLDKARWLVTPGAGTIQRESIATLTPHQQRVEKLAEKSTRAYYNRRLLMAQSSRPQMVRNTENQDNSYKTIQCNNHGSMNGSSDNNIRASDSNLDRDSGMQPSSIDRNELNGLSPSNRSAERIHPPILSNIQPAGINMNNTANAMVYPSLALSNASSQDLLPSKDDNYNQGSSSGHGTAFVDGKKTVSPQSEASESLLNSFAPPAEQTTAISMSNGNANSNTVSGSTSVNTNNTKKGKSSWDLRESNENDDTEDDVLPEDLM